MLGVNQRKPQGTLAYGFFLTGLAPSIDKLRISSLIWGDDSRLRVLEVLTQLNSTFVC
jgi:hypothetical protein